jgi:uncharacterized RDD family membrane protein YckC
MYSAEPFDRRSVNDPSQPAPADGAWRAEVASRVSSYRARRKSAAGEDNPFALGFGPAAEAHGPEGASLGPANLGPANPESTGSGSADMGGRTLAERSLDARNLDASGRTGAARPEPRAAAHNAFDTRYYRRLNAESMSAMTMGATAAATAPARQEPAAGYEAENRDRMPAALEPASLDHEPRPQEAASPAIDLEFYPGAGSDAGLERDRISDAEAETLFEAEVAPSGAAPVAAPFLPPQGNLIAFPRPLLEPPLLLLPSRDELAEPVHRRPRILEVPEDIMPAVQGSLFPEIRLDADEPEVSASREPEIEVPLPVAPVSARLMAAITDLVVVAAAGALFAAIACRALPEVPRTKPFWMALGGVTLLLWAVYQHLFLLYAGRTVGMSLRGIHLSTFDGRAPEWAERRRRARFIFISFASVTLGFLWALVDEDTLCWHDRVSQTFPTTD